MVSKMENGPATEVVASELLLPANPTKVKFVDVDALTTRPDLNPRIGTNLKHAENIAAEFRLTGVIPTIRVWEVKGTDGKWEYHVSRGLHRTEALRIVKKSGNLGKCDPSHVPVEVAGRVETEADERRFKADFFDHNTLGLTTDLEWLRVFVSLRDAGRTIKQMAALTRKSESFVKQRLDTYDLPLEVFKAYEQFEKDKSAGKDPVLHPDMPVFNQQLIQDLVKAYNAKTGEARNVEGAVGPEEFDRLWDEWKTDKGRTLVESLSVAPTLKKKEIVKLRAEIADRADEAVKEAMLAVVDSVLRKIGSDVALKKYLARK